MAASPPLDGKSAQPAGSSEVPPATLRVTSGGKLRAFVQYSLDILPVSSCSAV